METRARNPSHLSSKDHPEPVGRGPGRDSIGSGSRRDRTLPGQRRRIVVAGLAGFPEELPEAHFPGYFAQPVISKLFCITSRASNNSVVRPIVALKRWNQVPPRGISPLAANERFHPAEADDSRPRSTRVSPA